MATSTIKHIPYVKLEDIYGTDLNTITGDIRIINGWTSYTTNVPSGITQGMYVLLQVWKYSSQKNDVTADHAQILFGVDAIYRRLLSSGTWGSWTTC